MKLDLGISIRCHLEDNIILYHSGKIVFIPDMWFSLMGNLRRFCVFEKELK
jgi:hypothetical protein